VEEQDIGYPFHSNFWYLQEGYLITDQGIDVYRAFRVRSRRVTKTRTNLVSDRWFGACCAVVQFQAITQRAKDDRPFLTLGRQGRLEEEDGFEVGDTE
jgi:hypothetical protein